MCHGSEIAKHDSPTGSYNVNGESQNRKMNEFKGVNVLRYTSQNCAKGTGHSCNSGHSPLLRGVRR